MCCFVRSHLITAQRITKEAMIDMNRMDTDTIQKDVLHVVMPTKLLSPLPPRKKTRNCTEKKMVMSKLSFFNGIYLLSSL